MRHLKISLIILSLICFFTHTIIVNGLTSAPISDNDTPPIIDGIFLLGEWETYQIFIENNTDINGYTTIETFTYFAHNEIFLYVMVDATGDPTDNSGDECLLWFHNEGVTSEIEIIGASGEEILEPFTAKIGYGPSPNNIDDHKIYEFRIPLDYLNTRVVDVIDFCSPAIGKKIASMPYDSNTGRDNEWPPGLETSEISTWDDVFLDKIPTPVGGEVLPNIIQIISGTIFLFIILGTIQLYKKNESLF